MDKPIDHFFSCRLQKLRQSLEDNNFEAHLVDTAEDAVRLVTRTIIPACKPASIAFGGSHTLTSMGLYQEAKRIKGLKVMDTFDPALSLEEKDELRRAALTCGLFLTGTNAITEQGHLVNLDMIGNRVGALVYGPRHVVVVAGRNKLVAGLEQAMERIKAYAAPVNAMRLEKKTPCAKHGACHDCKSPDRICNVWSITEKSFPAGRIKVVLVNQDLGF